MASNPFKLLQFWQELKRRKVGRVITVYAAAAFVILEVVSIIVEPLGLPEWTLGLVIILEVIGFIIAIILSWVYDMTPGGLQKTGATGQKEEVVRSSSKVWRILIPLSLIIIAASIAFYFAGRNKSAPDISKLEKSIAVLPFTNWSTDENHAHLGNALANEIITEIYKVREFHVVSYTSSARYKDPGKLSIPEIGRELGANFIVEGTVERQNNEVSIHVQVILAENDSHIWAHEFKGNWEDIFQIQDEIAFSVADKLQAVLTEKEKADIDKASTTNPEAYDHYLRGLAYFETNITPLTENAILSFKEAIKLDSTFALPWTYLSMCYWRQTHSSRSELFQQAKKANQKALELDPHLSISNMNMAEILDNEYNFVKAEKQIELGLDLDPEHIYVLRNAGRFYTLLGLHERSISYCRKALEYDPTNPTAIQYLTMAYLYSGRYEEAKASLVDYHQLGIKNSMVHYQLLLEDGQFERIEKEAIYMENSEGYLVGMAAVHLRRGERELAKAMLDRLKDINIEYYYHSAIAYAYNGEVEKVCDLLGEAYEAGERQLTYLLVDPAFEDYREEPKIKAIIQKMNYPGHILAD